MNPPSDKTVPSSGPHDPSGVDSLETAENRPTDEAGSWFRRCIDVVGLLPPKQGDDPYAHRRGEPRGLAVLWLVFLLGASAIVYTSVGMPNTGSPEGYRFASKMLMSVLGVGVVVAWPMLRLSQHAPDRGGPSATLRDLIVILAPVQAFYWPQVLLTGWGLDAIALAAMILFAWTLLAGAVVALALGPARPLEERYGDPLGGRHRIVAGRVAWMLVLVIALTAAPVAMLVLPTPGSASDGIGTPAVLAMCSPLTAPWEILRDRIWTGARTSVSPQHWRVALLSVLAGLAAWAVVVILTRNAAVARASTNA
ncbi:MAG: hypothetical protein ACTS22_05645 [Phycisphaerales bacterium]